MYIKEVDLLNFILGHGIQKLSIRVVHGTIAKPDLRTSLTSVSFQQLLLIGGFVFFINIAPKSKIVRFVFWIYQLNGLG